MTRPPKSGPESSDTKKAKPSKKGGPPPTFKSELPINVLVATIYALKPEKLSEETRFNLDKMYSDHDYFKNSIDKLRKNSVYFANFESAP